jgi:hypothetical protein
MNTRKYYLLNYIFIPGTILLCLNDHYFKWEFSNWLTGKLSDFIGILILPFLFTFLFPRALKWNVLATGLIFIVWKSPYAQGLIDWYNSFAPIKVMRVIDYTDHIALIMLPVSYMLIRHIRESGSLRLINVRIHPLYVFIAALIVFVSSCPPKKPYYLISNGTFECTSCMIELHMHKEEILTELRKGGIRVYPDTLLTKENLENRIDIAKTNGFYDDSIPKVLPLYEPYQLYYKVDEIVIGKDIIRDLQFALEPVHDRMTRVFINGMDLPQAKHGDRLPYKVPRHYKKLIKERIPIFDETWETYEYKYKY